MTVTDSWEALADAMADKARIVVFSGAGISTESGIPDFRSPGGIWSRYDPRDFTFARYVASPEIRQLSWKLRREFWEADPQPNAAHRAVARLEEAGLVDAVVTQNIDGLHQAAGSRTVVEVHGTSRTVMCIGTSPPAGTPAGCGFTAETRWAFERLDAGDPDPRCPECGGLVKSATVSFGQNLFPGVVERALRLAAGADLVLTVGSSLQVYPAADIPASAARLGVPLAVVNDEPTPLDDVARVVVCGRAGQVLPPAVDATLTRA